METQELILNYLKSKPNLDEYYSKEIDEREILTGYNFSLIPETLQNVSLFTSSELTLLNNLQRKFSENIAQLSDFEYQKDMERLAIALVLLSYLQAFTDGNKRMARITANALLIANKYCPISFRTVDSIEYKKAMLLFYEQNNISAFKQIFVNQFKFAVENYF